MQGGELLLSVGRVVHHVTDRGHSTSDGYGGISAKGTLMSDTLEPEDTYQTLVEHINDAITVLQCGKIVYQNPARSKLLGYTTAEIAPRDFLEFLAPADRQRVADYSQGRLHGEAVPEQYEVDLCTRSGGQVTVEVKPRVITYHGEPATLVVMRDITERKQAARALQEAHRHTTRLLAAIPSILMGIDRDTRIIWLNAAAERTFGVSSDTVCGRLLSECGLSWESAAVLEGLATCCTTREVVRIEDVRFRHPDGTEHFLGITITLMPGTDDDAPHFLLMAADITARKQLQRQLTRAQKLESIGQLAAGIAHEINTPTQYVGDNTRFLQEAFRDLGTLLEQYTVLLQASKAGVVSEALIREVEATAEAIDVAYLTEEIPRAIQQSLEGVERVAKIVRAMKEFSHPGNEEKTAIDLNRAIESTLTVARNEWKYVADMVTDFDPALPSVACLPGELNQVVLNIVVNAAHAIADMVGDGSRGKGTITVSTRQDGAWVEIRIADTGTGIPEAVQDRIFDPFFTTKEVGKGTGQGLAIAHDVVVKKHGGMITCTSETGRGTAFFIRLPLGNPTS